MKTYMCYCTYLEHNSLNTYWKKTYLKLKL
jgi:hypothetical protein